MTTISIHRATLLAEAKRYSGETSGRPFATLDLILTDKRGSETAICIHGDIDALPRFQRIAEAVNAAEPDQRIVPAPAQPIAAE